jgi:hypothetical protein
MNGCFSTIIQVYQIFIVSTAITIPGTNRTPDRQTARRLSQETFAQKYFQIWSVRNGKTADDFALTI